MSVITCLMKLRKSGAFQTCPIRKDTDFIGFPPSFCTNNSRCGLTPFITHLLSKIMIGLVCFWFAIFFCYRTHFPGISMEIFHEGTR
jgi:hypothetical protein